MAAAGIPVFVAKPNPYRPGEHFYPASWQEAVPDPAVVDEWQEGWGIAAVGGVGPGDFLDIDPRSGGDLSARELQETGDWPLTFGTQATPSGGTHELITTLGMGKKTGFMPGIDLQGGLVDPDGEGRTHRAFVWIAPTVRKSKVDGELRAYRWVQPPMLELLAEAVESGDGRIEGLRTRVRDAGQGRVPPVNDSAEESQIFSPARRPVSSTRAFSVEEAKRFIEPALATLREAPIGLIEELGMAATLQLEHFVPIFLSPGAAFEMITEALGHTAYDPNGPSSWTADKFLARLDGRRPSTDSWKATLRPETAIQAPTADDVDALLAEMLTLGEVCERPAPAYLVKGLLNLDSEAWMIGAPGTKKSFVVLDMAAHVALGRPWYGLNVTRADVVMLVAEGAGGLSKRVKAWAARHQQLPDNVHVLPRPVQAGDQRAWGVLVEACRRLRPGLIVVDTQARVTVGLEENSATDMGHYVSAVNALKLATGACVLTLHHTGRSGGDARGSSAIDGAQDTEIKIVRSSAMLGELHVEKQKDLEEVPAFPLFFEVVTVGVDEDGDDITSLVLRDPGDPFETASRLFPETEPWESNHGPAVVQLLKVLRDQGGTIGLTKAEARASVVERFYDNDAKKLHKSTWQSAWTRALEKTTKSGDSIAVNISGEKWVVDAEALKEIEDGAFNPSKKDLS